MKTPPNLQRSMLDVHALDVRRDLMCLLNLHTLFIKNKYNYLFFLIIIIIFNFLMAQEAKNSIRR